MPLNNYLENQSREYKIVLAKTLYTLSITSLPISLYPYPDVELK